RLVLEQLGPEAASFAPAEVHAEQHLGPVLRLEAARTGMDLDDRVPRIVLAAEKSAELECVEVGLQLFELLAQLGDRIGIALLGELEEHLHLVEALALPLPPRDRSEHLRGLAADCLRALGVVPEAGGGGLLVQLGRTPLEPGEVKGASRARR